jgi:hypothetical protein
MTYTNNKMASYGATQTGANTQIQYPHGNAGGYASDSDVDLEAQNSDDGAKKRNALIAGSVVLVILAIIIGVVTVIIICCCCCCKDSNKYNGNPKDYKVCFKDARAGKLNRNAFVDCLKKATKLTQSQLPDDCKVDNFKYMPSWKSSDIDECFTDLVEKLNKDKVKAELAKKRANDAQNNRGQQGQQGGNVTGLVFPAACFQRPGQHSSPQKLRECIKDKTGLFPSQMPNDCHDRDAHRDNDCAEDLAQLLMRHQKIADIPNRGQQPQNGGRQIINGQRNVVVNRGMNGKITHCLTASRTERALEQCLRTAGVSSIPRECRADFDDDNDYEDDHDDCARQLSAQYPGLTYRVEYESYDIHDDIFDDMDDDDFMGIWLN